MSSAYFWNEKGSLLKSLTVSFVVRAAIGMVISNVLTVILSPSSVLKVHWMILTGQGDLDHLKSGGI